MEKIDLRKNADSLADSIIRISDAMEVLNKSRLNRKAVVILLRGMIPMSGKQIEKVLDNLPKLKAFYTKKNK